MNQKTLLSVVMITYGHEQYIRDAIDGVLMQQCNFDFELILANDCSPDATDTVILEILKTHPKASKVRYINHENNIGMMPNFIFALKQVHSNYIALCDGDDYWTDPYKLQKQVDFLEANEEYVLAFHPVQILKPNGELVQDFITKVPEDYETQETLARLGNYIHTPSVVFKNVIKEFPAELSLSPIGDYFLYMLLSEHGKLKYFDEEMAVYRYGVGILSNNEEILKLKKWIDCLVLIVSITKNTKIKNILFERYGTAINHLYKSALLRKNKSIMERLLLKMKTFLANN